jgi:hypothetical protein
MIDRLWWVWQTKNGNSISSELLYVVLAPFNMKVRDVLNINDLGYDYAAAQTVVARRTADGEHHVLHGLHCRSTVHYAVAPWGAGFGTRPAKIFTSSRSPSRSLSGTPLLARRS